MAEKVAKKSAEEKRVCFTIMPISTPEGYRKQYGGDEGHFGHVYEHLFAPAIEKAGYRAEPPDARGAENIHARIIEKLISVDLVLCDISIFNPNVFFELGVRSAMDKPVCYVMDEFVKAIPFDNNGINHAAYSSTLKSYEQEDGVKQLAKHIEESAESCKGTNPLWQWYGLSKAAQGLPPSDDKNAVLTYLTGMVENLQGQIRRLNSEMSVQQSMAASFWAGSVDAGQYIGRAAYGAANPSYAFQPNWTGGLDLGGSVESGISESSEASSEESE